MKLLIELKGNHNEIHNEMWSVCNRVEQIAQSLEDAPEWGADAINHASVK